MLVAASGAIAEHAAGAEPGYLVGAARQDITPDYPIRLSGYGNRRQESEGVAQRIFAKAMAISAGDQRPVVLLTVDNCGVPGWLTDAVARRLQQSHQLPPAHLVVCSTHTHAAPMLQGVLPLLFGEPIPAEQQATITRYSHELVTHLTGVAQRALEARRPCHLQVARGRVTFAMNRRSRHGGPTPVDHSLPVLRAVDEAGTTRVVLVNYACHATTVFGDFNRICGDWPGFAQEALERQFPSAVALVAIGCGADAKPNVQGKLEHARQHGMTIASAVRELARNRRFRSLNAPLSAKAVRFSLPLAPLPGREDWLRLSAADHAATAYHARTQLARLDRAERLPTSVPYRVHVWTLGDQLAMVFLAGEVVADYSVLLGKHLAPEHLWLTAYANDVPCYIPSRRLLREGGYEPDRSMVYYDRPGPLAPACESKIIDAVLDLVPQKFRRPETGTTAAQPRPANGTP